MGILGAATDAATRLSKFCHIYPRMMELDAIIPYLKKIQIICESRDAQFEFC